MAETSLDPESLAALALVDVSRLGVFGHSFGGAAAVWAASETPLLRASANMDGRLWGELRERGSTKPTLFLLSEASADADGGIAEFTRHAVGLIHRAEVSGALHNDFSDTASLIIALAQLDPRVQLAEYQVGAIDPGRALAIESAYLWAFFEATWSGEPSALLAGQASEFPPLLDRDCGAPMDIHRIGPRPLGGL